MFINRTHNAFAVLKFLFLSDIFKTNLTKKRIFVLKGELQNLQREDRFCLCVCPTDCEGKLVGMLNGK